MANTLTVSVAMATHRGERFVTEQLESIASQTRCPDELIVCDDASDDRTCELVEAFASTAPFDVRLVRNPERLGTTANFGKAVSLCSGDIIFFADQDDHWRAPKVERMLEVFARSPETGAVLCNGDVVDEERRALGYDLWRAVGFDAREQSAVRAGEAVRVFMRHVVAAGTTLAFRGDFKPLLLPFPELRSAHDAWVAFMIAAVSRFEILDEPLIEYRLHDTNQFGLKLFDLLAQYRQARVQLSDRAFAYAASFFREARERLREQAEDTALPTPLLEEIDAKIAHSELRDAMPRQLHRRMGGIGREALSGRYNRYGYGWKSIAQDIFLRG
jgi:glycosyltransferase involved in cell wall biosynthesis